MNLRPMNEADIDPVVEVIDSHDDDDAEDARRDFELNGTEYHWVAELDHSVVGVSGYRPVPETTGSGYISWTYVHEDHRGRGIGKKLFSNAVDHAVDAGAQKLFIKVSNYVDEDGDQIYLSATKMYESFGFECELISKDFYDDGEDQLIFSKSFMSSTEEDVEKITEKPTIRFIDIFEIAETNGAYSFSWEVTKKPLLGTRSFSVEDLRIGLKAVAEQGGRIVFLTFLSNLPLIHSPLVEAGFKFVGELKDYYEPGIHELHFVQRLDS
jgi:ribosomal protein S18 acetylase RimI-like enzyme